ncbi:uncharacterized protein LOC108659778 [Drosophila navojoa]|nr:uncharacterized protein LOC108659778 [Drosophila navojoa]
MVNFNNGTKIMVNRCIELLNAKIAHAQTRHIAKRVPVNRIRPRKMDAKAIFRERQKAENYEASKRLSMWEQNKGEKQNMSESLRMDHSHYKHCGLMERTYDCTWADFPEDVKPKSGKSVQSPEEVQSPRRESGNRPDTAKPWDAESEDFIKQWENNNDMINRNRFATTTTLSRPLLAKPVKTKLPRKKMFFF